MTGKIDQPTRAEKLDRQRGQLAAALGVSPDALPPVFRDELKPLMLGIGAELLACFPDADFKALQVCLTTWCTRDAYLETFEAAEVRYGPDNTPASPLNDGHRMHAKNKLRCRQKRRAERAARQAAPASS